MKKRLLNRRGETMVEVIVAFLVVLLGIGAFGSALTASVNLYKRTTKLEKDNWEMDEQFYAQRDSASGTATELAFRRGGSQDFTCLVGLAIVEDRYIFTPIN